MNNFERKYRMAVELRKQYPKGTRIELLSMNDPYDPVPAGTRGTVDYVDDGATIHMLWDNGRTLSIEPNQDSFRKLTEQEIEEENTAICVEETNDEMLEDEEQTQSMGM